jgi:hypothetical protein
MDRDANHLWSLFDVLKKCSPGAVLLAMLEWIFDFENLDTWGNTRGGNFLSAECEMVQDVLDMNI